MTGRDGPPNGFDRSERIDFDLTYLLGEADMLAETLPEWAEISENERGIWQFEWPNHLAILEDLNRSYRAGEMSGEQRVRYEELLAKLRELTPALEGTGLRRPAVIDRSGPT